MSEVIPPTRQALAEALILSSEILKDVELSQLPLTNIALKATRLARLLNDFDMEKILEYEIGGYPSTPEGIPPEAWRLAVIAGRKSVETASFALKTTKEVVYTEPISVMEEQLRITEASLAAARDPETPRPLPTQRTAFSDVLPLMPQGNEVERNATRQLTQIATKRLASRRNFIYQYVLRKHYELKFSGIADDVFSRIRERVDATVGETIPESVKRFLAVYENLRSDNPEDWSNAVHSCRRILQDLADVVFPPTDQIREADVAGKVQRIKLGKENYINRIVAFIEDRSASGRFQDIVGSHISFLGNRLDSIVEAANKGSHNTIVSREEADRYVVYTYLLVGDILSLLER